MFLIRFFKCHNVPSWEGAKGWVISLTILSVAAFACSGEDQEKLKLLQQGNEQMSQGRYDDAIDFYDKALQLDPEFTDAYNNMGVAFFENDEPGMALECYNNALRLQEEYHEARFNRVKAYSELGRVDAALQDLVSLEMVFPDTASIPFLRGLVMTGAKDYDAAIEAFISSGELNPGNSEIPVNIGNIYYYQEQFDSATVYLQQALAMDPDQGSAYNALALVSIDGGDPIKALEMVNQALDKEPDNPYFLNNRGYIYLEMDSLDRGEADINESIRIDPFNGWAYRNRALVRMKQGNYEAAIGLLRRAIAEDSEVDKVYYYLGEAYYQNGETEKACKAWQFAQARGDEAARDSLTTNCSGAT